MNSQTEFESRHLLSVVAVQGFELLRVFRVEKELMRRHLRRTQLQKIQQLQRMCWGKPSKHFRYSYCYSESQILLHKMSSWAWALLLHLRAHHRDPSLCFHWSPCPVCSTIYLSIYLERERSLTEWLLRRRRDWKRPERDIFIEQNNVDHVSFSITRWSRSCKTSIITIIERDSLLRLKPAARYTFSSEICPLVCAKPVLIP